ncbi:MAG TPA: flagellar type III secretion system protein FlhB, partial [Methylomirabilota bacterium]|nr:flagellar type III secretion system protein FlhB [Methylomirabilota bacterium]
MAEQSDDADKTEDPTQRRLEQAHEKGDVAKSHEVATFFTLGAVTLLVAFGSGPASRMLMETMRGLVEHAGDISVDGGGLRRLWLAIGAAVALAVALPVLGIMIAGAAGHLVQHRPVFSAENMKPKLSKISLISGVKRLVSPESLVNFLKGVVKLSLVASSMLYVLWPHRDEMVGLVSLDLARLMMVAQDLAVSMLGAMMAAMFLVAAADFMWVRHRWMKRQRMSLQEVKEEYKQTEGDPAIKGKIRQIRAERARKRMMAAVPTATVVVTNPTHYAVALKYETGMQAPVCVAKGVDDVALRIRALAEKSSVVIVENPPLARTLYATVDLDEA